MFEMLHNKEILSLKIASPTFLLFFCSLVWVTFVFVLMCRFGHMPETTPIFTGDSEEYVTLGKAIIEGNPYSLSTGEIKYLDSFRTPGYPLFIAVILKVFGTVDMVIFFQLIFFSITTSLIYKLGNILFDSKIGLISALLWTANPLAYFSTFFVWSDFFFTFILLCSVYTALQAYLHPSIRFLFTFFSGVLFGYAILTRPIIQFIPLVVPVILFCTWCIPKVRAHITKQTIQLAGMWLVACFMVVSPWMLRNYIAFNSFSVSSVSAFNVLYYNLTLHNAYIHNLDYPENLLPVDLQTDISLMRSFEYEEAYMEVVGDYMKENWFSYFKYHLIKTTAFFIASSYTDLTLLFSQDVEKTYRSVNFSQIALQGDVFGFLSVIKTQLKEGDYFLLLFLGNILLWVCMFSFTTFSLVFCLVTKSNSLTSVVLVLFAILVLYFAILTGPVTVPRYRLPIEPYVFLAFSSGFMYFFAFCKKCYINMVQERSRV
jgi:4-amino-4-deoxy-L-arabinose transferase-like glycosyltransferase